MLFLASLLTRLCGRVRAWENTRSAISIRIEPNADPPMIWITNDWKNASDISGVISGMVVAVARNAVKVNATPALSKACNGSTDETKVWRQNRKTDFTGLSGGIPHFICKLSQSLDDLVGTFPQVLQRHLPRKRHIYSGVTLTCEVKQNIANSIHWPEGAKEET